MASVTLSPAFGFVAASVVGTWAVHHVYMSFSVGKARKQFGVKYPALYATEADCKDEKARNQYNCVQRAHQNSLENLPSFLALLLVAGLKYPVTASIGALFYLVGRVLYFDGYSSGNPEKRLRGSIQYIGVLTLVGTVGKIAYDLISAYKF